MKFFIINSVSEIELFKKRCMQEKYTIIISVDRIVILDISNKTLIQYKESGKTISKIKNKDEEILEKILCSLLKKSDYLVYASHDNLLATLGISYQYYQYCKESDEFTSWEINKNFMYKVLENNFSIYFELNNLKKLFNYI